MRPRIPEPTRWTAVEKWMLGYSRNTIAIDCEISNGAVTSIVDEWRQANGLELADFIRTIGVTLRRLGMTPAQCAIGLRVHNLVSRIGLDENSIESFLSSVYSTCQEMGVNPNHIAKYIYELSSLLENSTHNEKAVSVQDIDTIFERRKQIKTELEQETKRLETGVQKILVETALCERDLKELAEQKRRLETEIDWNWNLKEELKKHDCTADDLSRVVDAARFFKDNGLSLEEMVMKFSNVKGIDNYVLGQQRQIETMEQRVLSLQQTVQFQNDLLEDSKLKNKELDELKGMGVGLRDIKILRKMITEVAVEEGQAIKDGQVMKRFISDIEDHYDDYLQLRTKVGQLKADVELFRGLLIAMGPIGPVVSSFLRRNPTSDEIREVIKIIEHFNPKASPESNSSSSSSSNNNVIYFSPSTDQEHSEPDTHEDVRVNPRGDSNQKEQEKISVTASQELVQKGDKDEDNNKQEYSDLNYSKSPSVTTASSVPPTKSNREGDKVVPPQSDQDEIQADTPLENLEDLFKKYGLSLIPRPVSENDPAVITPDSYTSLPHYANHISRKARKKPSYPTPLPNRISLRSISLQKEKMSLDSLDPGSTAFERYTTFNVANNNAGDNNAVNAVVNKEEPILEATDHSRLDSGGGAGPPAAQGTLRSMEKICRQKQLVNNWLSGDAEMNYGDFNLGSLVDESITKPIMRQIIKGESHFLENHKVRFGNDY